MKDEIKEINIKMPGQILDYVDTKEHLLELFNHINNLQEEVNKLTAESTEWESKCYDLQEELKEYKMIFDTFSKRPYAHRYLEEKKKELGNKNIIGLDSEMIYKDYYDLKEENERLKLELSGYREAILREDKLLDLQKYKQRNEIAIQYIKLGKTFEDKATSKIVKKIQNDLLNILNGDDKYE